MPSCRTARSRSSARHCRPPRISATRLLLRSKTFSPRGEDNDPRWVAAYVRDSREWLYDWLTQLGVSFQTVLRPPGNSVARLHMTNGKGLGLVEPIYRACLRHPNIRFMWATVAEDLIVDTGRNYRRQGAGSPPWNATRSERAARNRGDGRVSERPETCDGELAVRIAETGPTARRRRSFRHGFRSRARPARQRPHLSSRSPVELRPRVSGPAGSESHARPRGFQHERHLGERGRQAVHRGAR